MQLPPQYREDGGRRRLRQTLQKPNDGGIQRYLLIMSMLLLLYEVYRQLCLIFQSQSLSTTKAFSKSFPDDFEPEPFETSFSFEIFSAPKPFVGPDKNVNLRAIRSWQNLKPKPTITLLGYEEGYDLVAAKHGLQIRPDIDKTFLGVPLFNSMFNIANQSNATISVIINGDIILLQDFVSTLRSVLQRFQDFLVVSARYDLEELPPNISEDDPNFYSKLRSHTITNGSLHTYGGMDLWAWNPSGPRLFNNAMPPFAFGRGKYDNWLTHETITAARRAVIDASEAMLSIHIRHGYNLVTQRGGDDGSSRRQLLATRRMFWSENKKSKFELFINIFLSISVGSYRNQFGSIIFAPWKLARCLEPKGICLVRRLRPGVCNCECSPLSVATQTDQIIINGSRVIRCGAISVEEKAEYEIPVTALSEDEEPTFGMPLTIRSVTEKVAINNTVIVTALNHGYREMMMNWVCNMRRLQITNFVVAALDENLYKYAFLRGLPVYFEDSLTSSGGLALNDAAYGTDDFKQLTKMKSRVVLKFLNLGYDTLWTDTDIVWFSNPLGHLRSLSVDLAIQSNAPDDEPANEKRRINSGFYLARANSGLVNVFEDVIDFAAKSRMSEQPCFYDIICGKQGEHRAGNDTCIYRHTTTKLLDRTLFPNGKTQNIWSVQPGTMYQSFPGIFIVHNNWIKGSEKKWERFHRHGFTFFDTKNELCMYPPREQVGL